MNAQPIPVRTWAQAIRDAGRYGQIRQIVLAYIHPDSGISRDEALNRIVRIIDTSDSPAEFGAVVIGTWKP